MKKILCRLFWLFILLVASAGCSGQEKASVPAEKPKKQSTVPAGPTAAVPEFSVRSGVFTKNFTVELKTKSTNAVVRYTLNGAEPEAASPNYSRPLDISTTTLLKAKAFEPGLAPSPTVSQTYTMLDASVENFTSNLPLVILNTFGQRISKELSAPVSVRFIPTGGKRAALTGAADYDGRGDLKFRGFSSLRFPKRSFTFKTTDDAGKSAKVPILGLPADSDWVLYAPYSDKTLMRDVLAYELSNKMGRWAARTKFVEVFITRGNARLTRRDYAGVYVFEEKIKRSKDRVNITPLTTNDNAEPNITGGYIFKRDHTSGPGDFQFQMFREQRSSSDGEFGFRTARGMHLLYVEPKETEITGEQRAWLTRYMGQFERALYGANFTDPNKGYAKFLEVDSFIDQHWIIEMSKNIDGFRYSCYFTKDRGGKLKLEPIWDWNLSFGNANYHDAYQTDGWYYHRLRESEVSWFRRLSQDQEFYQRHIDRWGELRRTVFDPTKLLARVDELALLLNEAQERNFQRWPILGEHVNPNWYVGDSYQDEIKWMKQWIKERIAWIDGQFPSAPVLSQKEGSVAPGTKLTLRGSGKVYYTLDGTDPRAPGGGVAPEAKPYSGGIVLNETASLFSRSMQNNSWSAPTRARFSVAAAGTPVNK